MYNTTMMNYMQMLHKGLALLRIKTKAARHSKEHAVSPAVQRRLRRIAHQRFNETPMGGFN